MVGGMVSEGRLCCWHPRLVRGVPRPCVGVPLVVYPVALLNGGVVRAVMPCLQIGSGTPRIVPVLLALFCSLFLFVWCRVCYGWGSAVGVLSSQCVGLYCDVCSIVIVSCCAVVLCAEKRRVACVMNSGVCGDVCCLIVNDCISLFPSLCLLSQHC